MVWSAEMSKNSEQHQENDPQSQSLNKIQKQLSNYRF